MSNPRIILLDEDTISKIAAGEVIERPASAVKELIENSIDAGAGRIEIEVKDGGKSTIRVTDNGVGMTKDELVLAVKRHATSKIRGADDLFSVTSLGFRGEALPTIAAVSKFEISSKPKGSGAAAGASIKIDGGSIVSVSEAGCPEGTTVSAADLFFNTPARKKYMRSDSTELSHIVDVVSKYVIARPNISFKLTGNGKDLIVSLGSGDVVQAFAAVYGPEMASDIVKVEFSSGYLDVHGVIVKPTITRLDRTDQSFYVNGRFVRNLLLSRALSDAYRSLIPRDRFPVAALFIDIDPREVDVNVHPTKREIRFAKPDYAIRAVAEAVSRVLNVKAPVSGSFGHVGNNFGPVAGTASQLFQGAEGILSGRIGHDNLVGSDGVVAPVCQILGTYIIAADGEGLVIVDQHAAHERIVYEELRSRSADDNRQDLLIPENIELNQADAAVLRENHEQLKEIGMDLEDFGVNSFLLRSVPVQAVEADLKVFVGDIISELKAFGKTGSMENKIDALRKLVACHSAIRAGQRLNFDEMSELLAKMGSTSNSSTCPHGRPTLIRFSRADLEKMFKRT
jgi:DNA mismatch repair protein MutL